MRKPAYTLIELLVAIVVSGILVAIAAATYNLSIKSFNQDQAKADIAQNARITLDRMARDLRQTPDVITQFPSSPSDTSIPQPGQIEFEDGHDNNLNYYRYYLNGTTLMLDTISCYFPYDPSTPVACDAVGNGGISPSSTVLSTQEVAEKVKSLAFYGSQPLQIVITTTDGLNQTFVLRTSVYERNA
ncbi:type II secretion system GspH family protein [Patescibacteria group bacterium]|nr:type II secretion system GspH family protein [Patescibacteria group bacterium]